MEATTFRKETDALARFIRDEHRTVVLELQKLGAPYNDEKDCYIVTAKRFPPEARILAKKYKKLELILNTLCELDELYTQG